MKKTLTVNLGGTVYNIDEDAYDLLDKYLSNLRIHFSKEEGSNEIINDFESRISELFAEKVKLGYQVITIEMVEEVITRMGKPEEIFESTDEESGEQNDAKKTQPEEPEPKHKKRLMRDVDNKIIGGVASGIAVFAGWDPTIVRLIFIICLLIPYVNGIALVYILLWIIIPAAKTATEKLEMRGENVTVENIGKTVTDGFNKATGSIDHFITEKQKTILSKDADGQPSSGESKPKNATPQKNFFQNLAEVIVAIFGVLLKVLAVLAVIVLLPVLLVVLVVLFALIMALFGGAIGLIGGGAGLLYHIMPFGQDFAMGMPLPMVIMGGVAVALLIGIPVFGLIYSICVAFFKAKPMSNTAKWILTILWICTIIVSVIYFTQSGMLTHWHEYWDNWENMHAMDGDWSMMIPALKLW